MKKQFEWIYNYSQADFYVKQGCKVVGVGKGKLNDVYVLFEIDDNLDVAKEKWRNRFNV